MESQVSDLQALAARVEKLERQNRWFKKGAFALLLSATALIVMGQTRLIPREVESQSFVLRDSSGNKRAELALSSPGLPMLRFFGPGGTVRAVLSGNGYEIFGTGMMTVHNGSQSTQVPISLMSLSPADLNFDNPDGKAVILLGGPEYPSTVSNTSAALTLFGPDGGEGGVSLYATQDGTSLSLSDSNGFQAVLGSTDLVTPQTGEKHKTSAASLVLFGKDGKVLWSAP